MPKALAAALIRKVQDNDLPISIRVANEQKNCNGVHLIDVLLEYSDPDIVNDVLNDIVNLNS